MAPIHMQSTATQAVSAKMAPPDMPAPTAQPPAVMLPKPMSAAPSKIALHWRCTFKAHNFCLPRHQGHYPSAQKDTRNQPNTKTQCDLCAVDQSHQCVCRWSGEGH